MRGAEDGLGEHDGSPVTRRELAGILLAAFVVGFSTGGWTPFF